jgi:hypothetical protein
MSSRSHNSADPSSHGSIPASGSRETRRSSVPQAGVACGADARTSTCDVRRYGADGDRWRAAAATAASVASATAVPAGRVRAAKSGKKVSKEGSEERAQEHKGGVRLTAANSNRSQTICGSTCTNPYPTHLRRWGVAATGCRRVSAPMITMAQRRCALGCAHEPSRGEQQLNGDSSRRGHELDGSLPLARHSRLSVPLSSTIPRSNSARRIARCPSLHSHSNIGSRRSLQPPPKSHLVNHRGRDTPLLLPYALQTIHAPISCSSSTSAALIRLREWQLSTPGSANRQRNLRASHSLAARSLRVDR